MMDLTENLQHRAAYHILASAFLNVIDEDARKILGDLALEHLIASGPQNKKVKRMGQLMQKVWVVALKPRDEKFQTWWVPKKGEEL